MHNSYTLLGLSSIFDANYFHGYLFRVDPFLEMGNGILQHTQPEQNNSVLDQPQSKFSSIQTFFHMFLAVFATIKNVRCQQSHSSFLFLETTFFDKKDRPYHLLS